MLDQLCMAFPLSMVFGQAAQGDWSPEPQNSMELWTQRGGAGRYRNIISQEYASYPLLWWSTDFGIENRRAANQRWIGCIVKHRNGLKNTWPGLTLSRNLNFIEIAYSNGNVDTKRHPHCVIVMLEMLLPDVEKNKLCLSNKWVIPVDILHSMSHLRVSRFQ